MKRTSKNKKHKKIVYLFILLLLLIIIILMILKKVSIKPPLTSLTIPSIKYETQISNSPYVTTIPTDAPTVESIATEGINPSDISLTKEALYKLEAYTIVDIYSLGDNYVDNTFYSMELDEAVKELINGISYVKNVTIGYDDLRYVRVLHYDFNGLIRIGELIVNKDIAKDIVDIFYELYEAKYPIEKMVLVDNYDGDDNESMSDNNTSAFNYREIVGSKTLSKHALGLAIDINPLYNPYVKEKDNITTILPTEGEPYIDRTLTNIYFISKEDLCYKAFTKRGFTWGGSWNSLKDYQHFEK